MVKKPTVSIIIPSFNQASFIEETILSVLKQDYSNIEFIIIDGASKDGSVDIIKKFKNQLAYYVSETDEGQTHAIVKGFERANGDYITWLCSDDILEPSAISLAVEFLEKFPDTVLSFGNRIRIDAKGNTTGFSRYGNFKLWHLKFGLTIPQETVLIRKSSYNMIRGLDKNLHMAMDFDLWCQLSSEGSFVHIPAFLGKFRSHEKNKSSVYSSELSSTGFSSGKPGELAGLVKKYFNKNPTRKTQNIASKLRMIQHFFERRTRSYKASVKLVTQIQKK